MHCAGHATWTYARILRTIELGHEAMKLLGFERPRIAVCGLNPHAGEHGLFGDEEERFIAPAIAAACRHGILCSGPHAGDTVFLQASRGAYDLVVAMYHDQGHIPMKLIDFEGHRQHLSWAFRSSAPPWIMALRSISPARTRPIARSMKQAMRVAARMAAARRAAAMPS